MIEIWIRYISTKSVVCKRKNNNRYTNGDTHATTTMSYSISKYKIYIKCWRCCEIIGSDVDVYFIGNKPKCIQNLKNTND